MKKEPIIQKWLDGELSPEEEKAFRALEEHDDFVKISNAAKHFRAPEFDREENYAKLKPKLNRTQERIGKTSWASILIRIAAVFVLAIGIYFLFFPRETTIQTLASSSEQVVLPDGSEVWLNDGSTLVYSKASWDETRKVHLEGEAFFDVEKGESFKVITDAGTVTVLGTEFNVKERKNYFGVTCYEGLVLVETQNKSLKLPAGNSFRIINGKLSKSKTISASPSWTQKISSFESVPFGMVIAEFERQYDIEIKVDNSYLNEVYTGSFTHTDIETALKSIAMPFNLKASEKGGKVILTARE